MNRILLVILISSFSISTFSSSFRLFELTGHWERNKVACASGEEPISNWQPWRVLLKFEAPNYYTIIRQREEFTSFETGDYFFTEANRVCFKNDFSSELIAKCYDVLKEENILRLSEFMAVDGECRKGDYVIRFYHPQ